MRSPALGNKGVSSLDKNTGFFLPFGHAVDRKEKAGDPAQAGIYQTCMSAPYRPDCHSLRTDRDSIGHCVTLPIWHEGKTLARRAAGFHDGMSGKVSWGVWSEGQVSRCCGLGYF